jgi:signal transduction histidine kinase
MRLDGRRVHHDSGHGLGLCSVRAIAAAHNAAIIVRARRGAGLSIEVTFPAMPDEPLLAPRQERRAGWRGSGAGADSAR